MKNLVQEMHSKNATKDEIIIKLVQEFNLSISKASKEYNQIILDLGLYIKKESKSQILIDAFIEDNNLDIQKLGEDLGLAKSSINYYKTMFKISLDIVKSIKK